jgi:hypothetical protein
LVTSGSVNGKLVLSQTDKLRLVFIPTRARLQFTSAVRGSGSQNGVAQAKASVHDLAYLYRCTLDFYLCGFTFTLAVSTRVFGRTWHMTQYPVS